MRMTKLFLLFFAAFLIVVVPLAKPGFCETNVYYGMLSKLQFDPPYVFLSTADAQGVKKFMWAADETIFIGADGEEMTPRQFARAYQGKSVEVTAEGFKAKIVKRVFY
mgnify:CR=1 FL=1